MYTFGSGFTPFMGGSAENECAQLQVNQNTGNPYDWKTDPKFEAVCDVLSLDFFDDAGSSLEIAQLQGDSTIILYFPCALNGSKCFFWVVPFDMFGLTKGC